MKYFDFIPTMIEFWNVEIDRLLKFPMGFRLMTRTRFEQEVHESCLRALEYAHRKAEAKNGIKPWKPKGI